MAFTRIDDGPIEVRFQIYEPDTVVVLDPTLMKIVDVTKGLKPNGFLIINTTDKPEALKEKFGKFRVAAVDATSIALDKIGIDVTNTAMLGAVTKALGVVELKDVEEAVLERFDQANVDAVRETFFRTVVLSS